MKVVDMILHESPRGAGSKQRRLMKKLALGKVPVTMTNEPTNVPPVTVHTDAPVAPITPPAPAPVVEPVAAPAPVPVTPSKPLVEPASVPMSDAERTIINAQRTGGEKSVADAAKNVVTNPEAEQGFLSRMAGHATTPVKWAGEKIAGMGETGGNVEKVGQFIAQHRNPITAGIGITAAGLGVMHHLKNRRDQRNQQTM